MRPTATEEPQTNSAQTIASNLEAVIEPVVRAELVVRVALENQAVQVAPENQAAQELVPAGAVRVLVQVAALGRIKSATAAHPRGLVPLLAAAEDLAAVVVAIMHAPAATEAA